jgi:hypothetical protein
MATESRVATEFDVAGGHLRAPSLAAVATLRRVPAGQDHRPWPWARGHPSPGSAEVATQCGWPPPHGVAVAVAVRRWPGQVAPARPVARHDHAPHAVAEAGAECGLDRLVARWTGVARVFGLVNRVLKLCAVTGHW